MYLFNSQKGFVSVLLIILAIVGLIIFIFLSSILPFKNKLFSTFFPNPTTKAAASTDTSYNLGVLVIKYFPLTSNGQNIDITITGDVGDPYTTIRQRTIDVSNTLKTSLEKATKYLGYKDVNAQSALTYQIVDTKEYTQAVPTKNTPIPRYPDYPGIMTTHNICNYVDNLNVREVWLWAYQGPNKSDGYPYLSISESKMASSFGDISNSFRYNDMPICQHTYRVYTFNYGRWTAEALESWGHQMEAELDAVNRTLFRDKFQGPNYPQSLGVNGRCGSVHNPPNARSEYDRNNPTPQNSDCLDWNPDSLGTLSGISCQNWGCGETDPLSNNAALNYMIWNWQNLPGRGNAKTYQGSQLRNWWDIHGDFDTVMGTDKTLLLTLAAPNPTPTPTPVPTPNPNPADTIQPTVSITSPIDGSIVQRNTTVNITANATDNVSVSKVEFLVNNSLKCTSSVTPYTCNWKVIGKKGAKYTITAKAYDPSNNQSSTSVSVIAN